MGKTLSGDQRIQEYKLALANARKNPETMVLLKGFNYGYGTLDKGDESCDDAWVSSKKQKAEYGGKRFATKIVKKRRDLALSAFKQTFKLIKLTFRNDAEAFATLGLNQSRKPSLAGWIPQALHVYEATIENDSFVEKMGRFGYDRAKLEAELKLVKDLQAAIADREIEASQAKQATAERNAKVDEMDQWMIDFKAVAKIALKNKPHLLEELNL